MVEMYKQIEITCLKEYPDSMEYDFHSRQYLYIREKEFSQNSVKYVIIYILRGMLFKIMASS